MPGSVAQATYERIRRKLIEGGIAPGDRLVNRTLAAELGVSVIPVREAIQRLATEGLVDHVPGAGAYAPRLGRKETAKLYAFREQLETYAVREAALHIESYQLQHLDSIIASSKALVDSAREDEGHMATPEQVEHWLRLDAAFHEALIEAADNPWLQKATTQLQLLSLIAMSKPRTLHADDAARTCAEHEAIVEAIRKNHAEEAGELMAAHIRSSVATALELISEI